MTVDPLATAGDKRIVETVARAGVPPAALGLEVRIGRVSRKNAASKALRYLVEGRLQIRVVTNRQVRADVRGTGNLHHVSFDAAGWSCTCPARSDCCHKRAVQTVVVVDENGGTQ